MVKLSPHPISDNDEEKTIQHQLLTLLTGDLQTSRYAAFEYYIKYYELDCYYRAQKAIHESNKPNKDHLLDQLYTLYDQDVKDYPEQNRQAILDNQIPEPISRNAGIAVNALCHQMFGFSK